MPSESDTAPWAYLLRLPAGTGAIALKYQSQTISRHGKDYFSIRRCRVGNPEIEDLCGVCSINERRMSDVSYIEHGWKISIPPVGKNYIFVECNLSNRLLRPISLNGTHAIAHMLGEGGFGKVFLCFDKKSTAPIALKIATYANDREKNIVQSLKHENIIETLFFINLGVMCYIGMEYMAGGDLSTFVDRGRVLLTETQTKLIFYQVADAVNYLHNKGVLHRDLKPGNILLHCARPRTLVKVTDLGISKSEILHSPPNTAIGTPNYMAPETLHRQYTKGVDVWSLGIMLYLSLTGSFPSVEGRKISLNELASNRTVTKLVKKMLQYSPTERPSMADIMKHEWLQDETMKKEATVLKREFQNSSSTPINVKPSDPSENLKQAQSSFGFGFLGNFGLVVLAGIILAALLILFK